MQESKRRDHRPDSEPIPDLSQTAYPKPVKKMYVTIM
jgi:hypothetical protein